MTFTSVMTVALRLAGPILLIAMGGLMAEKVGIFNLALEGFALVSCFATILGAYLSNSPFIGILTGIAVSVLFILLYAVLILELRVDTVICAIAIITVASGITRFLVKPVFGTSGRYELPASLAMPVVRADWLGAVPVIGPILNGQSVLILLALLCPFLLYYVLYWTGFGMRVRAVGLDEEAAQAAGIHVKKTKYLALLLNGIFCGLGGAQLALSVYMFNIDMTDGRGYIALASVTMAGGHPLFTALVTILFGLAEAVEMNLSKYAISSYLLEMIPYFMAIIAAVLPYLLRKVIYRVRRKHAIKRLIGAYEEQRKTV